ncbi:MAG: 50S ribosomal protein L13 [Syntrophorhabdaceae bacterium]|nr:50S ribosomal protein L13 [Syntrophorhabdaceae bacterium]
MNKTFFAKPEDIKKNWYVINAEGEVLGRLAAKIAVILRGKDKPVFTPHVDTGDFVVVVNAEKVKLTGKKLYNKNYARHSGYPGGLRLMNAKTMLERKPEEVIKLAVKGMLPKNMLGRKLIKKLKVYRGPEHPHAAQMPKEINLSDIKKI